MWNILLALPAFAGMASAHMVMSEPAPLKAKNNPNSINIDYSYSNPLSLSGSDYPCKGYLSALGTSEATPVDTWSAGDTREVVISGHTIHGGGSCQVSLSVDGGNTFKTLHTYIGGCPAGDGHRLSFQIPSDTPSTDEGIVAWSWFNNLGNREMYMNCAVVRIENGGDGSDFNSRPGIFRANTNGCRTVDSRDVMIPNPGPNVMLNNPDAVPPTGDCEGGPGADSGSGSGFGSGNEGHGGHGGDTSAGYKPGNDWPAWLQNHGWVFTVGSEQALLLLGMMMLSMCLHYTWFSNLV
ncbi:extracellular protein [Colletotrichum karsti]|uniref:Extracellular protein n=1 Tax=Colletotrichum karsti TaxID=1095194 RepID=A0A9P6I1W6_9PEZI|nr:extracellular protein [Colletotrichum karsti]KAF9874938.1 extracellular protein [Colletotrichum karsti]